MKGLFLLMTFLVYLLLAYFFVQSNTVFLILIWLGCLLSGLYIKFCVYEPKKIVDLGWGLLYGSLLSLILSLLLIGYLTHLYS